MNCRKTSLNKPTGNKAIQPFVHFPISGYLLYVSLPLRCNAAEIDKACKPHLHHHCLFHFNSVKMNYEMFRESFLMPKGVFHKCLISFIHSDKKKLNAENNRNTCRRVLSPFRWLIPPILTVLAMCHLQKRSDHIIKQFHIDYHFTICQEKCSNDSTKRRRKSNKHP